MDIKEKIIIKDTDYVIIGFVVLAICTGIYILLDIKAAHQEKLQHENIIKNILIEMGHTNIKILKHLNINISYMERVLEGCITTQYSNTLQNRPD